MNKAKAKLGLTEKVYVHLDVEEVKWVSDTVVVPLTGEFKGLELVVALNITLKSQLEECIKRLNMLLENKQNIIHYIELNHKNWERYQSGYFALSDGTELDLMEGICFYASLIELSYDMRAKIAKDWSVEQNIEYNRSYPVEGETCYDADAATGTLWINPKRWEYVEFLIKTLTQYLEKL
ncbi:hypothetical protein Henu6_gp94 [Acinetobacter phage Henu6]|uniref:Uncharacterized protein n=2 Tax=Caudoviricetes TaxID=2731619 RepID=A0A410T5Z0_9CAUD|nr:hypothetical protein Henu6_gp94 [Acinetobacter phage Henu6]